MNSTRARARVAGVLYLLMGVTAAFGVMYIPAAFIVPGDAAATARRITDAEFTYRIAILSDFVSQIIFLFLVMSLYNLLRDVNRSYAALMVLLVTVAAAIELVNLLNLIAPLILLSGADFLSAFTKPQLDALALGFLRLRGNGIFIVSAFWGLWLFPFGILIIKSGFFPKILGVLLIVACFAYLTSSFISVVLPAYQHIVSRVTLPLFAIGELSIILWLLIRGANAQNHAH